MQFQLTSDFIENIAQLIAKKDGNALRETPAKFSLCRHRRTP